MKEEKTSYKPLPPLEPIRYITGIKCPKCGKRIRNGKVEKNTITHECGEKIEI